MKRSGLKQEGLRTLCGFGGGYISRVLNGKRCPTVDTAVLFQELFDIPIASWATKDALRRAEDLKAQYRTAFFPAESPSEVIAPEASPQPPAAPVRRARTKSAARTPTPPKPRAKPVVRRRGSPSEATA